MEISSSYITDNAYPPSLYHQIHNLPESLQDLTDVELVAEYLNGNKLAFRTIIARYHRVLLHAARKYADQVVEAEDLLQEALLKAAKNLHAFRGDCSLCSWLYRLIANAGYDHLQKQRFLEFAELDDEEQRRDLEALLAHDPVDAEIASIEIRHIFHGLSRDLSSAFVLMDVHGYNQREAARISGVSSGTMKLRRFQAKSYLRQALQAWMSEQAGGESVEKLGEGDEAA